MRIVHVAAPIGAGGLQGVVIDLCTHQAKSGHGVTLITCPPSAGEDRLRQCAAGGGFELVILDALPARLRWHNALAARRAVRRALREMRPDLVHSHNFVAGMLARPAGKAVGAITVHSVHGPAFFFYQKPLRRRWRAMLERRAARFTDAFVAVSDSMARYNIAARVGRAEQYTVIYSGVDPAPFLQRPAEADSFRAALNLPPGGILITRVCRMAVFKGQEYLVQAARLLPEHIHFCLVGDGPRRAHIEQVIAREGMSHRFHVMGRVSDSTLVAAVHAADFIATTSLIEGMGRTVVEGMLAGKAVAGFDAIGVRDLVRQEQTGLLVPCLDVPALADSIRRLADDAGLRDRLGQAGRQLAIVRFTKEIMLARTDELYERLTSRASEPE